MRKGPIMGRIISFYFFINIATFSFLIPHFSFFISYRSLSKLFTNC